jgi:hypothetical protein
MPRGSNTTLAALAVNVGSLLVLCWLFNKVVVPALD